jgi:nitrogen fixation/metabolism regulation signal transduction histidine kinase
MAAEVKRLRGMVGDAAKMLREFSAKFWLPTANSVTYSAMAFIEDFRHRLGLILPETAPKVHWTVTLRKESVSVDLEMLTRALIEVFRNTSDFREGDRSAEARVSAAEGHLVIELLESKSSVPSAPEAWGREPLVSTRRSGFGMGLYYTRRVLQGHGGEIAAEFDAVAKRLTTRITLPLAEV